jgi:hypothetical protein
MTPNPNPKTTNNAAFQFPDFFPAPLAPWEAGTAGTGLELGRLEAGSWIRRAEYSSCCILYPPAADSQRAHWVWRSGCEYRDILRSGTIPAILPADQHCSNKSNQPHSRTSNSHLLVASSPAREGWTARRRDFCQPAFYPSYAVVPLSLGSQLRRPGPLLSGLRLLTCRPVACLQEI